MTAQMFERRKGRIVSVASIAALVPIPDASAYGSSKAALVRFSESPAMEVAEFGIGVFSIALSAADLVARLASRHADPLTGRLIHVHDDLDDLVRRADAIRRDDLHTLRLRR